MLVQCQNCGVQFAFEQRTCVSCGEHYQVKPDDYESAVVPRVAEWLLSKMSGHEIRDELVAQFDLPPTDAEEILRLAETSIRARNRRHGGKIAISGMALLGMSAVILGLTGGTVVAGGAAVLGFLMFAFGLLKRITGWNITGHDED